MSENNIPLVDLKSNYKSIEKEVDAAIKKVMDNTSFINGPAVKEFEGNFSKFINTDYCIGVSSGLEALSISLLCLDIGKGDEVILPANTFIATALAVSSVGAKVILVDCDENDLISIDQVELAITDATKAIMPVHLYGRSVDMNALHKLAKQKGIYILEDAAQAHGSILNGVNAGSSGVAGCFSFYPGKNLGAFGDGGAICTSDENLANRVRSYSNYGSNEKYVHDSLGSNNRLDSIQAAVLGVKLKYLPDWNKKRIAAAKNYEGLLKSLTQIERPILIEDGSHVYHVYAIRIKASERDRVMKKIQAQGVGVSVHYPIPIHLQKAYAHLGLSEGAFPISEKHAKEMISLPIYPEITLEQQKRVVDVLKASL
jgi:dTDP-4-amino-4,6-dideoxygalactose transaminase